MNYKLWYNLVLQVLEEQRMQICKDSCEREYNIYSGVHSENPKRSLHFDCYVMTWLDQHWNKFSDLMDKHKESFPNYDWHKCHKIFAKNFKEMLIGEENLTSFSNGELISELLKTKERSLHELIEVSNRYDENFNSLKLEATKHKDIFEKKLKELSEK